MNRHTVITIELDETRDGTRVRALVNGREVRKTRVPPIGSLHIDVLPLVKALLDGRSKYPPADALQLKGAPNVYVSSTGYDPEDPRSYRCGGSGLFPPGVAPFGPIPKGARESCLGCPDCQGATTTATTKTPAPAKSEAPATTTATGSWASIEAAWKAGDSLGAIRQLFDACAGSAPRRRERRKHPQTLKLEAELRRMEKNGELAEPRRAQDLYTELHRKFPDLSTSYGGLRQKVKIALSDVFGDRLVPQGKAFGRSYSVRSNT